MISVNKVSKYFENKDGKLRIIDSVSLNINEGEFITFIGPNGSGKTTLFNMIAGLEKQTSGQISIDGKNPKEIKTSFVFQNYNESLFPWLTVMENIKFPLNFSDLPEKKINEKVEYLLSKSGLANYKNNYPHQLSGGMKQLTAICRAFVNDPEILLMDEPCSALDFQTTKKVELEILGIWQEKKPTTLFISHDLDEAIFLADRVVVFTPRPAKIKDIFTVSLPRPRTLNLLTSQDFFELRKKILSSFSYE
jgi:ABC-type nitrate/sulfonate/bicarbonate transport system ATPase subunit